MSLFENVVGCLITPHVIIGHITLVGILYGLAKATPDDVRRLIARTVLKYEIVRFLLWLFLPDDGLTTALSLLFCLCSRGSADSTVVAAVYQTTTVTTGR